MELPTHQPLVDDSDDELTDDQIRQLLNEAAERMRAKAAQPQARTEAAFKLPKLAPGRIADPKAFAAALSAIPGVVEHGLFIGLAQVAILAGLDGIQTVERP